MRGGVENLPSIRENPKGVSVLLEVCERPLPPSDRLGTCQVGCCPLTAFGGSRPRKVGQRPAATLGRFRAGAQSTVESTSSIRECSTLARFPGALCPRAATWCPLAVGTDRTNELHHAHTRACALGVSLTKQTMVMQSNSKPSNNSRCPFSQDIGLPLRGRSKKVPVYRVKKSAKYWLTNTYIVLTIPRIPTG